MSVTAILPGKKIATRLLAALPSGEDSPLARMGTPHFARWLVMHDLVYQALRYRTVSNPPICFSSPSMAIRTC